MRRLLPKSTSIPPFPLLLALLTLLVGLVAGLAPASVRAQDSSDVVWERYDVTLDVRSDGSMHVTEYQVIAFNGRFSSGYVYIPLGQVEAIENVSIAVAESESDAPEPLDFVRSSRYDADPGAYTYQVESGELAVDYAFEPTSRSSGNDTRVVVLEYDVIGGIRVYEDLEPANQQVWWYAISRDVTDIAPVRASTVTVNFPEPVAAENLVTFPENAAITAASVTWERSNLDAGDEFEVSVQFPPITAAQVPAWQAADDQMRQSREEAQERSDWAGFLLLIAGLITTFGGGIALLALWFATGRDPQVGLVAEYIETPPDDLRPGAAGVLLDEAFNTRDVVATVLDLANRGVLKMTPREGQSGPDAIPATFTLLDHSEQLRTYEQEVLRAIFGSGAKAGTEVALTRLAGSLASNNAAISKGFYQNLVDRQYFTESPEQTRTRWHRVFRLTPLVVGAVVILIVVLAGAWSNFAFFPLVVGLVIMMGAGRLANAMPRKTVAGAESAAKWRAFRSYLEDIEKRNDVEGAQKIFAKYLPHAVALGLSEHWVQIFSYVPAPTPVWYEGAGPAMAGGRTVVVGRRRRRSGRARGGTWTQGPHPSGTPGGSGGGSSQDWSIPSLQDASDTAAGGLQGGSDSFFGMLGTIAEAFAESSKSGSGSFGSSGRSGGFTGGGSRGGGSRSRGGGGGGGRRGFR